MSEYLTEEEVLEKVKSINEGLRSKGLSWDEIEKFWDDFFKKAKKEE